MASAAPAKPTICNTYLKFISPVPICDGVASIENRRKPAGRTYVRYSWHSRHRRNLLCAHLPPSTYITFHDVVTMPSRATRISIRAIHGRSCLHKGLAQPYSSSSTPRRGLSSATGTVNCCVRVLPRVDTVSMVSFAHAIPSFGSMASSSKSRRGDRSIRRLQALTAKLDAKELFSEQTSDLFPSLLDAADDLGRAAARLVGVAVSLTGLAPRSAGWASIAGRATLGLRPWNNTLRHGGRRVLEQRPPWR
jgi:hypothetical protein